MPLSCESKHHLSLQRTDSSGDTRQVHVGDSSEALGLSQKFHCLGGSDATELSQLCPNDWVPASPVSVPIRLTLQEKAPDEQREWD